jgi:hypothetical protein
MIKHRSHLTATIVVNHTILFVASAAASITLARMDWSEKNMRQDLLKTESQEQRSRDGV